MFVFVVVRLLVSFSPSKWNSTEKWSRTDAALGKPCPGRRRTWLGAYREDLRWEEGLKLWNSRGSQENSREISLCHLALFRVPSPPAYCFSSLYRTPTPPLPDLWINSCVSLSLNFTYDFPGAKHSKQAPLSLSWNAPGDATHVRRVARTHPYRAGSDAYDL